MKYYVGITDSDWYNHLSNLKPDEVNFWRPSGKNFYAIDIGAPFLFKLHSPNNYIVGGGYYIRSEALPLSLAWDAFGEKNGAGSYEEFNELLLGHRRVKEFDPLIGCIILNNPFFLPQEHWIPVPSSWSKNIVSGRSYNTSESEGEALWNAVSEKIEFLNIPKEDKVYGNEYLIKSRLGQGAFRLLVTSAYKRRCSISGEKTVPALQAAHIKPVSAEGPNHTNNGLLLRSDLHLLFDKGLITVTPDCHVLVSKLIRDKYQNGKEYYKFDKQKLVILPDTLTEQPNKEYLDWHNNYCYKAV